MPTDPNATSAQPFTLYGRPVSVTIVRARHTGARAARIEGHGGLRYVPVDLLPYATGRDEWMREILVRCSACRRPVRAGAMTSDLCPTCSEEAEEENRRQDEG